MPLKKELVAQAKAHNKRNCIKQISTKTKAELARSLGRTRVVNGKRVTAV